MESRAKTLTISGILLFLFILAFLLRFIGYATESKLAVALISYIGFGICIVTTPRNKQDKVIYIVLGTIATQGLIVILMVSGILGDEGPFYLLGVLLALLALGIFMLIVQFIKQLIQIYK